MIIAIAGLPGSGKTTLAKSLAEKLPAIVLNKDILRAALFSTDEIQYSNTQDDFVINIMLQLADYYIQEDSSRNIILDGRTFSNKAQVDSLVNFSQDHNWNLQFIYCTCSDKTAKARIERDSSIKNHLAENRDYDLYKQLKAHSDPLSVPHLSVDTEKPLEFCTLSCLEYLNNHSIINK